MHERLWQGVELKLQHAEFHLDRMGRSIQPPERTGYSVALAGAIPGPDWQRSFYAHFDAFLSATRSIGQVIKCCFGKDTNSALKPFNTLPPEEQERRSEFQTQLDPNLKAFDQLPLSTSRHLSEHRTGYSPVTVTTTGLFGVTYIGGPVTRIPNSETRQINEPGLPTVHSEPLPVLPLWSDFVIDGQPLFPACQDHFRAAQDLIGKGRIIADQVHGIKALTARW